MDFLQLSGKTVVVFGVANKKSVAWHIGKTLEEHNAKVIYVVRSEARRESAKLLGDRPVYVCDVEFEEQIEAVRDQIATDHPEPIAGLVHSIAFAAYDESGIKPFHETGKQQLLRTFDISCYSFIAISNAFKELLAEDASVVTISISTTTMASENYGFMAPVKAALDSSLAFLAKSFSKFSSVRFNAKHLPLLESPVTSTPTCLPNRSFREERL
jgi:enoyl-[acyl-carrier protein] reductase I